MLATAFRPRVVLAVLAAATCALASIAVLVRFESSTCGGPPTPTIVAPTPEPPPAIAAPAMHAPADCFASVETLRTCAHRLYVAHEPEAAGELLWSVLRPWGPSAAGLRIREGIAASNPYDEGLFVSILASKYKSLASSLRGAASPDPRASYWPLVVARDIDAELGGAYGAELWARIVDAAPRAAKLYASGRNEDDCVNYADPAATAKRLGIAVAPLSKRCPPFVSDDRVRRASSRAR